MIYRTFGFLGLLASVMALSSLVYGAFQEPLGAYMQGVMGGVMEVYRTMRDLLFAGLGWTFSVLINFFGQWLSWLPRAPWFNLFPFASDLLTIYVLTAGSFYSTFYSFVDSKGRGRYSGNAFWSALLWPFSLGALIVMGYFSPPLPYGHQDWQTEDNQRAKVSYEKAVQGFSEEIHYFRKRVFRWILRLLLIFVGAGIFFLLAYAENQIGL